MSNVAVNRAIKRGRLKAGVNADGKITDPVAARAEYLATLDLTRAPDYVHQRVEVLRAGGTLTAPPRDPSHGGRPPRARAHEAPRGEPVQAAGNGPPGDGRPQPAVGGGLTENNAVKAYWQALHEELDYRKAAGKLVPAADVDVKVRNAFHVTRTKLLTLPSRAKTLLGLNAAQVLKLEALTRELLEELAAGRTP